MFYLEQTGSTCKFTFALQLLKVLSAMLSLRMFLSWGKCRGIEVLCGCNSTGHVGAKIAAVMDEKESCVVVVAKFFRLTKTRRSIFYVLQLCVIIAAGSCLFVDGNVRR